MKDKNSNEAQRDVYLAKLIKTYMPYIQKRTARFCAAGLDSDDLIQEGLIGLFKGLETYDSSHGARFSTYAITCINNCITTAVKQAARKKNLPLNSYLSLSEDDGPILTSGYTPEELAIAAEGYAALKNRINCALSDFEREVLVLYLEGYDYLAVAKRLDTTSKSVDNALQRARNKLKLKR